MIFWRKKKNAQEQEQEEREDKLLHPQGEPDIEPPTEYDSDMSEDLKHELEDDSVHYTEADSEPVPKHTIIDDAEEAEDLKDHSEEGGWLSRLTLGLSKSSKKITQNISDLVTKRKLDEETQEQLEEVLISADLGPQTAEKIVEDFSKDRFGKDISDEEISRALAQNVTDILTPVAQHLQVQKPEDGPFVILVCGVNGAGKTTTIGKLAYQFHYEQNLKVTMAAGDTFRAAATEQLGEWAKRTHSELIARDVGADAASVAYEAYTKAKEEGADVLMIDTAGRLQNKANLMEELQKIIRVLKKQDENLPHATLLVLDATTGQNAFSQVETFKDMVNVDGLIVTKLDGSAKAGVLVGLADQFGIPVHAIGVGESIEDLQPFCPREFANSLMGIDN